MNIKSLLRVSFLKALILVSSLVGLLMLFSCESKSTEPQKTVATPVIELPSGIYSEVQIVSISCSTENADIYYTTNGSIPTEVSSLFTSPITITNDVTIKAKAFKTGSIPSSVAIESFIIYDGSPVVDIDGNQYQTKQIGNQIWMTQNLKVTRYRNGDGITRVTDFLGGSVSFGQCLQYGDLATHGFLYNYFAIEDTRGLAPEGWKIPTDEDFKQLEIYLGMPESDINLFDEWRGTNQGSKMAGGINIWQVGNLVNDLKFGTSGLNLYPSGKAGPSTGCSGLGSLVHVWTSTFAVGSSSQVIAREIHKTKTSVNRITKANNNGAIIRCVKTIL
jgi:uncharacterized protein (TIGR02145 family)